MKIQTASYDWRKYSLTIKATSSDEVSVPVMVAQGYGRLSKSGIDQNLTVSDLPQPPATVTVKSAAEGAAVTPSRS